MATFNAYPAARVQLPTFAQALAQAQSIKANKQAMQFQQMQMDALEKQADRDARLQELSVKAAGGDEGARTQLRGQAPKRAKALSDAESADYDATRKRGAFEAYTFAKRVSGAQTPEDVYAIAIGAGRSPEQAEMAAANFAADPDGYRREAEMGALTIKERFAQRTADARLAETGRHNRATEGAAYLRASRPDTVVNVGGGDGTPKPEIGTIPQGYQAVYDKDRGEYVMRPVQGGPASREIQAEETAKAKAGEQAQRAGNIVLEDISRIEKIVQESTIPVTGTIGSLVKQIPGTNAYDVSALIETIGANIGLDKLQQMREASPTGGALGQVTEREHKLLQAVLGNLSQSQTEEQFMQNLSRLRDLYEKTIHGEGGGMPRPQSPQDMMKLEPGTRYMAPDGSIRVRQ